MDGSLNEAERPEQSPASAHLARAVALSVVIDGRLDAVRARQVALLADRLGLAGIWLRYPSWPLGGSGTSGPYAAGLLGSLATEVSIAAGLVVDAGTADPGEENGAWLD